MKAFDTWKDFLIIGLFATAGIFVMIFRPGTKKEKPLPPYITQSDTGGPVSSTEEPVSTAENSSSKQEPKGVLIKPENNISSPEVSSNAQPNPPAAVSRAVEPEDLQQPQSRGMEMRTKAIEPRTSTGSSPDSPDPFSIETDLSILDTLSAPPPILESAPPPLPVAPKPVPSAPAAPTSTAYYHLIGGSFSDAAQAETFIKQMQGKGFDCHLLSPAKSGDRYRVSIFRHTQREKVDFFASQMKKNGMEGLWILRR